MVYVYYRRTILERKLADAEVSKEEQNDFLKNLEKRETEYMRLQRHKMGSEDFEPLTMIGKGAFGEVGIFIILVFILFYVIIEVINCWLSFSELLLWYFFWNCIFHIFLATFKLLNLPVASRCDGYKSYFNVLLAFLNPCLSFSLFPFFSWCSCSCN